MPIIKVIGLPQSTSKRKLRELYRQIITAVVGLEELALRNESDVTCRFPLDMIPYEFDGEIVVEVTGLFIKLERTKRVRSELAITLGSVVQNMFPRACIECFIFSFDPKQGFWSSRTGPG